MAPPKRVCAHNRVRNAIVSRILDGSYAPGTRLKEMALAAEFEVSQAPVREALRELETLGLVEAKPYCGCTVRSADAADLREAYEMKMIIEERSANLAVPCQEADLDALDAEVVLLTASAASGDTDTYAAASLAFHRQVVVMSGNRQFLRTWDGLLWPVRTRLATMRARTDMVMLAGEHATIAAALRRGDGETAGKMLRHMILRFIDLHAAPAAAAIDG
jgi:DNA-binding GntR family transcriptional regulator